MYNLNELIEKEIENGYGDANDQAKVCQDIILKAIASGSLNRNVTIKGGVVIRSKTGNIRRATQDLDIDFVKYSLSDESIDAFIRKLNCLNGIVIVRSGAIEELKQQDYHGKRVYIEVSDELGNQIHSKLDLGVHNRLDIEQEEYCFDIAFDEVRKLDNKKCLIFIRGFDPILDNKYIPFAHPMFGQTADGKGKPYVHEISTEILSDHHMRFFPRKRWNIMRS